MEKEGFITILEEYYKLAIKIHGIPPDTSADESGDGHEETEIDDIIRSYRVRINEMLSHAQSDEDYAIIILELLQMMETLHLTGNGSTDTHMSYENMLELIGNIRRRQEGE